MVLEQLKKKRPTQRRLLDSQRKVARLEKKLQQKAQAIADADNDLATAKAKLERLHEENTVLQSELETQQRGSLRRSRLQKQPQMMPLQAPRLTCWPLKDGLLLPSPLAPVRTSMNRLLNSSSSWGSRRHLRCIWPEELRKSTQQISVRWTWMQSFWGLLYLIPCSALSTNPHAASCVRNSMTHWESGGGCRNHRCQGAGS